MRGQLTEAGIPGVWQIAAQAMGKTSQELDKAITRREIKSADLIEALADALHELSAPGVERGMKTIEPVFSRFSNTITMIANNFYQDWLPTIRSIVRGFQSLIEILNPLWWFLSKTVRILGIFIKGLEFVVSFIADLINRPKELFKWLEAGMPTPGQLQQNTPKGNSTVEHRVIVSPSEAAKKELEIKHEKQIQGYWTNFSMEIP